MASFNNPAFSEFPIPDWNTEFDSCKTVSTELPYEKFSGVIKQSMGDKNKYRLIRLPNNLLVACVQDSDAKQAAVSLSVNVGYFADPPELPGMAHFLEHMLFMGSKKYPVENEYNVYISNHSGYTNAYTAATVTNYYFEVDNSALEGALDILSSIITDPLLNPNAVDREVSAVNSEFTGSITNEFWRTFRMARITSNPNHPYSKFNFGNIESLKGAAKSLGLDLHTEVAKFHKRYYSADIMKLVIVGSQGLDQLTEWAVSMFSGVESKGNTTPNYSSDPLTDNEFGKVIHYEPINEDMSIELIFQIPNARPSQVSASLAYIMTLINCNGTGSLQSVLKQKGYSVGIDANVDDTNIVGNCMLNIEVSVTQAGVDNYRDVVHITLCYLKMLAEMGPQEWYFNELKYIKELKFHAHEKKDNVETAIGIADDIHNIYKKPEEILLSDIMLSGFNPQVISNILKRLTSTDYKVYVKAKVHPGVECANVDQLYGIKYSINDLPQCPTTDMEDINDPTAYGFHMPKPNRFLPTETKSIQTKDNIPEKPIQEPTLLKKNDKIEVWFKKDDQFFDSRGVIAISFGIQSDSSTPKEYLLSELYCSYINQLLCESLHDATVVGYVFNVIGNTGPINLIISGFSQKIETVFQSVINVMSKVLIDDKLFSIYYNDLMNKLQSELVSRPLDLAAMKQDNVMRHPHWQHQTLVDWFKYIGVEDLQKFADRILKMIYTKVVVVGFFEEENALRIADTIDMTLHPVALPDHSKLTGHVSKLDPGYFIIHKTVKDQDCQNSAIQSLIHCGPLLNIDGKMKTKLITELMDEPFFDQLRTKEQLGYLVFTAYWHYDQGEILIKLEAQGDKNPMYTTMRMNMFLRSFRQQLLDMDAEALETKKKTLAAKLKERKNTIAEEADDYIYDIFIGNYDFKYVDKNVDAMSKITKEDLILHWDKYVNPETAPNYKRVDCLVWSTKTYQPTEEMLKLYSSSTLALYCCLVEAGLTDKPIEDIHNIVANSTDADTTDTLLTQIKELYKDSDVNAQEAFNESSDEYIRIRTAVEMALDHKRNPVSYVVKDSNDFTGIGMIKTPEEQWIITNIDKFKTTQSLVGKPAPVHNMIPKY